MKAELVRYTDNVRSHYNPVKEAMMMVTRGDALVYQIALYLEGLLKKVYVGINLTGDPNYCCGGTVMLREFANSVLSYGEKAACEGWHYEILEFLPNFELMTGQDRDIAATAVKARESYYIQEALRKAKSQGFEVLNIKEVERELKALAQSVVDSLKSQTAQQLPFYISTTKY